METMSEKLTWTEIKERYPDEWVELIDCDWDEFEVDPRSGVVRLHAKKRRELHELMMKELTDDSAVVYTGDLRLPEDKVFNATFVPFRDSDK